MSNDCPDRVGADLREHERQQEIAEKVGERADEIARDLAKDLITDGRRIHEMVIDYELLEVFDQLARAMRNIILATIGEEPGKRACIEALNRIDTVLRAKALEVVADEANRRAWQEHNER